MQRGAVGRGHSEENRGHVGPFQVMWQEYEVELICLTSGHVNSENRNRTTWTKERGSEA